jgi:hypothetical protein
MPPSDSQDVAAERPPDSPRDRAAEAAAVREALERVLASHAFKKSEQCQRFLRYVVEHRAEPERLRERSIGIEVFGRKPDYDTAEDPIVRVRATEVRKRLAQAYGESGKDDEVRFEIPAGSYRVELRWGASKPVASAAVGASAKPRGIRLAAALALALVAAAAVWGLRRPAARTALDEFWQPMLASPKPVLVYCGRPVVYFLSRELREKQWETPGHYALDPDATLRGRDVIPVTDQFVGIGNADTAVRLTALFANRRKPVEIRYADDLSFSDLRSSPAVLVGAFSNLWTLEMQGQLRFVFEQGKGGRKIRDRRSDKTWQLAELAPDGRTPEDYAVVSRLVDSATGQVLVSAAGITQYGTRAAGELLTDEDLLAAALAKAPAGWQERKLQILLHARVYKGIPAAPTVLAVDAW